MTTYSLEAVVTHPDVAAALPEPLASMGQVPLSDGLVLVPVPLDMLAHLYHDEPVLDAVREVLGPLVAPASARGDIAYVHAELVDGEGSEGVLVWRDGEVVFESYEEPATDVGPIDRGLAALGVHERDGRDAFDQLDLRRHHLLGEWIADAQRRRQG